MKEHPYQITEWVAARRRAVLPSSVSRPLKRSGGRASPIPAHVRMTGVALGDDDRADIRRKIGDEAREVRQVGREDDCSRAGCQWAAGRISTRNAP